MKQQTQVTALRAKGIEFLRCLTKGLAEGRPGVRG
jgi:hypothetical protein